MNTISAKCLSAMSGCRHAPMQISFQKINYKKSLKDKKCHYSPLYWNAISAIKRKSVKEER